MVLGLSQGVNREGSKRVLEDPEGTVERGRRAKQDSDHLPKITESGFLRCHQRGPDDLACLKDNLEFSEVPW